MTNYGRALHTSLGLRRATVSHEERSSDFKTRRLLVNALVSWKVRRGKSGTGHRYLSGAVHDVRDLRARAATEALRDDEKIGTAAVRPE